MPETIENQIKTLQAMAKAGSKISEILTFLALDQDIEQQLVLMERCQAAFGCNLGNLTAIGAWWHDGSCELNNDALDDYIHYVVEDYLNNHQADV